jgi:hypothetical protein
MNHQRVMDRILDVAARDPECSIDDVMRLCPDLTWNQVFLDVDRLSREGHVRLRYCARGIYTIEVPDQEVQRGVLADKVEAHDDAVGDLPSFAPRTNRI